MKKNLKLAILAIALLIGYFLQQTDLLPDFSASAGSPPTSGTTPTKIGQAFARHLSNVQVQGHARIIKILPDDLKGSRHQRFIIRLENGQTLLVAHNIDLAPRVPALRKGADIEFYGEYEWNKKGGVVHWTHRDPRGRHRNGWLRYKGKTYQ